MSRITHTQMPLLALFALWCAGLGAAGQFAKLSVPFEHLAASYPNASSSLGLVISILSAVGVICGFFAGLLVSRFGFRRILLWALWLGAVLSALQIVLPPLPVFLLLRLVEGASHLVIVVAAPTLMAQLASPKWRAAVMTIWSTFFGASFALTSWFGLPLVGAVGLPALIAVHAAWMALVALALTFSLRPLPNVRPDETPFSIKAILKSHVTAYASPVTSAPALGWLCYTLTFVALLTVLPSELSADDRDWVRAIMPLAGLSVSLTLGIILLRWLDGIVLAMAGFALAAVGAVLLMLDPQNAPLAIGVMGCLGLVQSGSFAAVPALTQCPAEQAQANGAMAQMGNLGNLLGTPLLIALSTLSGTSGIYAGLAVAYTVGLAMHIWQAQRRRAQVRRAMTM